MLFGLLFGQEHNEKHYWHYKKDLTYLQLTKTQEAQIKSILKTYRHDIKNYREERERISKNKKLMFLDDHFDGEKLKNINERINKSATEIEIKFLKNVHKILSFEQRKKFAKYINEWDIE